MFIVLIFLVLLMIGVPIAFVLGLTGIYYVWSLDLTLLVLPQRFFVGLDQFILMAIPFFILAGELMTAGGLSSHIINFAKFLVGSIKGGLAMVNVVASMIFAGISGSAQADTSALGSILIPEMVKEGYDVEFSTAVTVASSTVGPIIPPSLIMVIYAMIAQESVGMLFIAGYIPGILLGLSQIILCYFYAKRKNLPKMDVVRNLRNFLIALKDGALSIISPLIIIVGILSGVFTPTEAGLAAAIYAFIVGFFVYRKLKISDLPKIFLNVAITTAVVFWVAGAGMFLGWALTYGRVPIILAEFVLNLSENRYVILFIMNMMMLFAGMFMESIAILVIVVPMFLKIALELGISNLHLGVVVVLNLVLGLTTPPMGMCLFIGCRIGNISIERLTKAIFPFTLVSIAVLLLITYVPWTVEFLPSIVRSFR